MRPVSLLWLLPFACKGNDVSVIESETPPVAIISEPSDGTALDEGQPLSLRGQVLDDEDAPPALAVTWTSDRDGVIDETPADANGNVGFTTGSLSPGAHVITLRVVDTDALAADDFVTVRVDEVPDAPEITIRHPNELEDGVEDEPFTFEAIVSDPSDAAEDLLVEMESDLDGVFCEPEVDGTGLAECTAVLSVGDHELTFTVADTDGFSASAIAYFAVVSLRDIDDDGDGFTENEGDCDDATAGRNPDEAEILDGIDNDCDDVVDEETVGFDDDGDGQTELEGDCDDGDDDVFAGNVEVCDGFDNDCDGLVDEGTSCVDDDGDGFDEIGGDCDDTSSATYPGAYELPDGLDNDCDGIRDEGTSRYDADGDCFCPDSSCTSSSNAACGPLLGGDCDDADVDIFPGAAEVTADGIDQDCDAGDACYVDGDGDAFGSTALVESVDLDCADPGESANAADCDDANLGVHPGATEVVADGVDSDCTGTEACRVDADGDGYGGSATVTSSDLDCGDAGEADDASDCNDGSAAVHPGATEQVGDEVDQDCDGTELCRADADEDGFKGPGTVTSADVACETADGEATSSAVDDCDDANAAIRPGATETVGDEIDANCDLAELCYADADTDGFRSTASVASPDLACETTAGEALAGAPLDCNDADADVSPGVAEVPGNEIDDDCDGGELCFVDFDEDSFRTAQTVASADLTCRRVLGEATAAAAIDCDDTDAAIKPGVGEIASDGIDQNCDGTELCNADADGDGHGSASTVTGDDMDCGDAGEADDASDCNDGSAAVHPGATELAGDEVDQDCDGTERCHLDADEDGYKGAGTVTSADVACETVDGEATGSAVDDCDDANAGIHPGATETTGDQVDANCDLAEMCYADADRDGYRLAGAVASADLACDTANGEALATAALDCNDGDAAVNPGVAEVPGNEIDDNCDSGEVCYVDFDEDSFRTTSTVSSPDTVCRPTDGEATASAALDCNDADAAIKPGASEIVGDEVDQDCDGHETCHADGDTDGYRGTGSVASLDVDCDDAGEAVASQGLDCNEANGAIHPGATELPGDEVDQDCDGLELCYRDIDEDGYRLTTTITSTDVACNTFVGEAVESAPLDCNDGNAAVHPNATELTGDGVDQDCDGGEICYRDADEDGYRLNTTVASPNPACAQSDGEALGTAGIDCNDGNGAIHPGATETTGNGVDENCNGQEVCYADVDEDGYRTSGTVTSPDVSCNQGDGEALSTAPTDCYDLNGNARPGQTGYFSSNRGDGSFDYNCDGVASRRWTTNFSCQAGGSFFDPTCSLTGGWVNGTPSCGVASDYSTTCIAITNLFCDYWDEFARTQECR